MIKFKIPLFMAVMASFSIQAQIVTIPQERPVDKKLEPVESTSYTLGFELPAVDSPDLYGSDDNSSDASAGDNRSSKSESSPGIFIKSISFSGYTEIELNKLENIVVNYINKRLTQKDLSEIRNKVTSYYVQQGYINSGAYFPDQDLSQAVLRVAIIEGKLSSIRIETSGHLSESYIRSRLNINTKSVLDINNVKQQLLVLQQDTLIETITARLSATDQRGLAELHIEVADKEPVALSVFLNNYRPPSVGEFQGTIVVSNNNLSGTGDKLVLWASRTEGLRSFEASYDYPVNAGKFNIGLSANSTDSSVVEDPFSLIDIENSSSSWAVHARSRLFKSLYDQLDLTMSLETKSSKTTIGNSVFNLNDINADETKASLVRFSQEWTSRQQFEVYALRSLFTYGVDINNATILQDGADGEFLAWLGQVHWMFRQLNMNSVSVRLAIQLSNDSLLPFEQFSAGGRYSVRGFRENEFVRDMGATLNLEYKIPFRFNRLHYPVDFMVFSDFSSLKNKERLTSSNVSISSIGLGVQGRMSKNTGYEVFWAHAVESESKNNDVFQDKGIHLQFYLNY